MSSRHRVDHEEGLPSLREILSLPVVRAGAARVCTGSAQLDTPIRWVHVSELDDIGPLLRGGELVLCTGIGLPPDAPALTQYVAGLVAAGVGGLMVELGRRFVTLPEALVRAAEQWQLPVIVLEREVRFVEITEAVHSRILDAQVARLRRSELIHRRFTALSVEAASAHSIVTAAAELCGHPVVLEDLAHRVLVEATMPVADLCPAGTADPQSAHTRQAHQPAAPGPGELPAGLLSDWERRSRLVGTEPAVIEVGVDEVFSVVAVGTSTRRWGRLIAISSEASPDISLVLERAAAALAISRLSERDELAMRVRTQQALIAALLDREGHSEASLDARAAAHGVPLSGRQLVGISVHLEDPAMRRDAQATSVPERRVRHGAAAADNSAGQADRGEHLGPDDLEHVLGAARGILPVLAQSPEPGSVRLLASLAPGTDPDRPLTAFARALQTRSRQAGRQATIGVGSVVTTIDEVARSLTEADHVVAAAPWAGRDKLYYELWDVRVRGLIHVLRDDPRLQHFARRELGALLEHDARRGTELLGTLETYLAQGRNKVRTARALHLSRAALYDRLEVITRTLQADLDDAEVSLSLHVAVLALRAARSGA